MLIYIESSSVNTHHLAVPPRHTHRDDLIGSNLCSLHASTPRISPLLVTSLVEALVTDALCMGKTRIAAAKSAPDIILHFNLISLGYSSICAQWAGRQERAYPLFVAETRTLP